MKPGYEWAKMYSVWSMSEVADVNMVTSIERFSQSVIDPHTTDKVELPNNGEIRFPLKKQYDWVNFTPEGIKAKKEKAAKGHSDMQTLVMEGLLDCPSDHEEEQGTDGKAESDGEKPEAPSLAFGPFSERMKMDRAKE